MISNYQLEDITIAVSRISTIFSERVRTLKELELELSRLKDELSPIREAISLAKKCVEESLEQKKYIENVVSSGLTEVFGVNFTFVLEPVLGADGIVKGLKPRLKEEGGEFDDPINSFGAGAQAVASICVRIALLLLNKDTANLLVLDEPLANVSPTLQSRFQAFVENTCRATNLQLIMVTHMDQPFGKVFHVKKDSKTKISSVSEVK